MDVELTARLDEWSLCWLGDPVDGYVLVGRVFGRGGLRDGHIASTSVLRFLAADLSSAITASQGRRYCLGCRVPLTLKGTRVLVSTLTFFWGLPDETPLRLDVDPAEVVGRHFGPLDG